MDYNDRMFTLLHDATYMLALESEERVTRKQFDEWRQVWMNEMGRLMIEMLAEKEKDDKGIQNLQDVPSVNP